MLVILMSELFSSTGEGWFETHMGCSASDIVKRLRKNRRVNKGQKGDIDDLIGDIRYGEEVCAMWAIK